MSVPTRADLLRRKAALLIGSLRLTDSAMPIAIPIVFEGTAQPIFRRFWPNRNSRLINRQRIL
jgi:hypothetical protein